MAYDFMVDGTRHIPNAKPDAALIYNGRDTTLCGVKARKTNWVERLAGKPEIEYTIPADEDLLPSVSLAVIRALKASKPKTFVDQNEILRRLCRNQIAQHDVVDGKATYQNFNVNLNGTYAGMHGMAAYWTVRRLGMIYANTTNARLLGQWTGVYRPKAKVLIDFCRQNPEATVLTIVRVCEYRKDAGFFAALGIML